MDEIQIITILSCIIFIIGYAMFLRSSFQKKVIGQLLCEFITVEGNGYEKLYPIRHGTVEIPLKISKKGRGQAGRTYLLKEIATFTVDYPANFPGFLQAKAQKGVFHEACFIPVSMSKAKEDVRDKSFDPLLLPDSEACNQFPPDILYNIKNASDTEVLARQSLREAERENQMSRQLNPSTLYVMLALVIIAIAGLGYYIYSNISGIQEGIEVLRVAGGV